MMMMMMMLMMMMMVLSYRFNEYYCINITVSLISMDICLILPTEVQPPFLIGRFTNATIFL